MFLQHYLKKNRTKPFEKKVKICLLIAHPDDEAMFFSPLLHQAKNVNSFKIICLTHKSSHRNEELKNSLKIYNIPESNLTTYNFADSQTSSIVSDIRSKPELRNLTAQIKKLEAEDYIFFSFDEEGVSGHVNHKDCYTLLEKCLDLNVTQFFKLKSCSLVEKYLIPGMKLYRSSFTIFQTFEDWKVGYAAMSEGHVSQMIWFRYLYLCFSRYMWKNDYVMVRPDLNKNE